MRQPFRFPVRDYYEDTDAAGVVYYANYLKFMERARTEWLRSMGHSQSELAAQYGYVFAVADAQVKYRKPARLDDELRITVVPIPEGRVSIRFAQKIWRGDVLLTEGDIRVACVDAKTFRPRPLPDFINVKP